MLTSIGVVNDDDVVVLLPVLLITRFFEFLFDFSTSLYADADDVLTQRRQIHRYSMIAEVIKTISPTQRLIKNVELKKNRI